MSDEKETINVVVDWENAPKKAVAVRIVIDWHGEGLQLLQRDVIHQESRKKEYNPTIAIGQFWESEKMELSVEIIDLKDDYIVVWNDLLGRFEFKKDDFVERFVILKES